MDNKGVSTIIGVVFLIAMGFIIAGIIFYFNQEFLIELGPVLPCDEVNFKAGFFENEEGKYFLDIANEGNIDIKGVVVKEVDVDKTLAIEELNSEIIAGESISLELNDVKLNDIGKKFLILPKVSGKNVRGETVEICDDTFGVEIVLTS